MALHRYFLELAYHGSAYHGWQKQPRSVTVQETLEKALSTALRQPIEVVGCGRTDTGVHASKFYAHFDCEGQMNEDLLRSVSALCGQDIAIYRYIGVPGDAHARFDATLRSYRYHMHFRENPFIRNTSWYWKYVQPDFGLMNKASEVLVNQKDFSSFCKTNSDTKTNLCEVSSAEWTLENDAAYFSISADRFLRGMVRLITGALLEVGQDKLSLADFESQVRAGRRVGHSISAPAHGLFLCEVSYPYI